MDPGSWTLKDERQQGQKSDSSTRPFLPDDKKRLPRDDSLKRYSPSSKYSSQHLSARGSATTIDVPLFLQSPPFDPDTAPPLPTGVFPPASSHQATCEGQHMLHYPPKIPSPLEENGEKDRKQLNASHHGQGSQDIEARDAHRPAQRPRFDPQNSSRPGHLSHNSQGSIASLNSQKQPRFDPQHSHENRELWETSHDVNGSQQPSHNQRPSSSEAKCGAEDVHARYATSLLHQGSVSPVHDPERCPTHPVPGRFDSPAGHVSLPDLQHNGTQQDGRSTTATDASSNLPALSTPESQQTSNTSYKDSETRPEPNNDEESNESFYWHSGRSSSDSDDGQDGSVQASTNVGNQHDSTMDDRDGHGSASTARGNSVATTVTESRNSRNLTKNSFVVNEVRKQSPAEYAVRGLPARSSSLSPNPVVSYTASALGFGSPSDWEYFGDYEADEIDDEELYTHKPRAELPSEYMATEDTAPPRLPELAEFHPLENENSTLNISSNTEDVKQSPTDRHSLRSPENAPDDGNVLGSRWSPCTTTPTTPHANSSRPITVASEPLPLEDHRPDLDEVIRAWSDSPYVGRSSDVDLTRQYKTGGSSENIAEASLASTPGENVLGIYAAPKDAPPLPKLPDPIDLTASLLAKTDPTKEVVRTIDDDQFQLSQERNTDLPVDIPHEQTSMTAEENLACQEDHTPRSPKGPAISDTDPSPCLTKPLAAEPPVAESLSEVNPQSSPSVTTYSQIDTAPATNSTIRTPIARTSSPSSDFARKRQMFESTSDRRPPPGNVPRKTLKELKISRNNSTVSEGTQSVTIGSDRTNHDKASVSSNVSLHASPKSTPPLSSKPSGERPQMLAEEASGSPFTTAIKDDKPSDSSNQSAEHPIAEHTVAEHTVAEHPVVEHPVAEHPVAENPVAEHPVAEHTVAEHPVAEHPVAEQRRSSAASVELKPLRGSAEVELTREGTRLGEAQFDKLRLEARSDVSQEECKPAAPTRKNSLLSDGDDDPSHISKNETSLTIDQSGEEGIPVEEKSDFKIEIEKDPYTDLDPWGRASLNRFAAMLREEARAESNKDKLNIFNVFASRESRLRVVLYGSDEELIISQETSNKGGSTPQRVKSQKRQHLANVNGATHGLPHNVADTKSRTKAKELPPLPPNGDGTVHPPISKHSALAVRTESQTTVAGFQGSLSGSLQQKSGVQTSVTEQVPHHGMANTAEPPCSGKESTNEARSIECEPNSSIGNTANGADSRQATSEADKQQLVAAATPRKVNGGEVNNYLTNRRSIYRPFATQTAESMENATNFGRESDFAAIKPPLPPILPATSIQDQGPISKGGSDVPSDGRAADFRRFVEADFDPLIMVLPQSHSEPLDSPKLAQLKGILDAVPDDFSFIHANVVSWDARIKEQREENERHRHARQIESEQRIDALFDDHEIGYGDIAELEGEFKHSEALKKAEEDRAEFRSFEEDVFGMVSARLNYELDQLRPHYEQYSEFMNQTLAGKEMFEASDGLALAPMMTTFLALHQKLEIRHQKAFEAVLERDRRLKRTEISPWYSLSNISKVKQLERRYESAEKKAIVTYCEQRNERANKLMDILDQNTLRGVGANQDYMEAIMKAVRRIASGRAYASVSASDTPTLGIDLVEKAKATTVALAASSEQVVQTFHVADMLLNNADYEVSVAKAKIANDAAALNRLKEERAKEDQKLMRDLEHRLALIREDLRRTNDEIIKLMLFIGTQNGRALDTQPVPAALGVRKEADGPGLEPGGMGPDTEARIQEPKAR